MCPFCGSELNKIVIKTSSWSIKACKVCSNAWTDPSPNNIDYTKKDFHSEEKILDIEYLPLQWEKSISMQLNFLKNNIRSGANILEIGCGQGLFINELKKTGFNVAGIDPSETATKKARERGLNVITGYFPCSELTLKKFDAIIMIQTLEHVQNLKETIKEIKKIAPNGILMLVQTNWRGLIPTFYKSHWYAWVPEHHYWHFTPKGLREYMGKFGFQEIKIEYSSLVHKKKFLPFLTNLFPKTRDQFHSIFKIHDL